MTAINDFLLQLKKRVDNRLDVRGEAGFSLIELLIVMIVIAILAELSVPAYLSVRAKAQQKSALESVRAAAPGMALWFSDHATYLGATVGQLNTDYKLGLNSHFNIPVADLSDATYCVEYTQPDGSYTAVLQGPDPDLQVGAGLTCP
jgi:prepilin-type N-terminal cleavage/methylation domain-containing protein